MLIIKHYVCISYRISEYYYGGKEERLGKIGQENRFTWDIYRDKSYLIIKVPEEK